MKTIVIAGQETISDLANALTAALSKEFNTSPDANGIIHPFSDSTVGYKSFETSATIYLRISNGFTEMTADSISYSKGTPYAFDVYYSRKNTAVTVALRRYDTPTLPVSVIAKNKAGKCSGIVISSSAYLTQIREDPAVSRSLPTVSLMSNYAPAFSLIKYPDMYAGVMFEEVYVMFSAPTPPTPKMIIHTADMDFIPIKGVNINSYLAMPISG